ncbi:hypothetical protein ACW0JT_16165 [Arthrobacter sp. SA17]
MNTSRVVNIASRYSNTKIDFDDLQSAKGKYSYLRSTPPTMLGRVLLTQEFAERLEGTGVVVNVVHPGLVKDTALLQDVGGPFRWITNKFGKPADKAVTTAVWLATAPRRLPSPAGFGPRARKCLRRAWVRIRKPESASGTRVHAWTIPAKHGNPAIHSHAVATSATESLMARRDSAELLLDGVYFCRCCARTRTRIRRLA